MNLEPGDIITPICRALAGYSGTRVYIEHGVRVVVKKTNPNGIVSGEIIPGVTLHLDGMADRWERIHPLKALAGEAE